MNKTSFPLWPVLSAGSIVLSVSAIFLALSTGPEKSDEESARSSEPGSSPDRLLALEKRIGELESRLETVDESKGNSHGGVAVSSTGEEIDIEATIDERIASVEKKYQDRLDSEIKSKLDKVSNRRRNEHGEWSPKIEELTEELSLSDEQVESATEVFDSAKDDLLSLFQTPQENGGSLLDDFVEDMESGVEPAIAYKEFTQRMWEENVPGTDRSYITDIIALRNDVFSSLGDGMDAGQKSTMESLKIDPLDVETGYDPIKEYVEAQMGK